MSRHVERGNAVPEKEGTAGIPRNQTPGNTAYRRPLPQEMLKVAVDEGLEPIGSVDPQPSNNFVPRPGGHFACWVQPP
jgi:hypothetical protein